MPRAHLYSYHRHRSSARGHMFLHACLPCTCRRWGEAWPESDSERAAGMLYLKDCPRCAGDIYADRDEYGAYRQCLQCGFVSYPPKTPPLTLHAANGEIWRPLALDGLPHAAR